MSKKPSHKKPGLKDVVRVVGDLFNQVNDVKDRLNALYGAFDLYIEYNKDAEDFPTFIDKKIKEKENDGVRKNEENSTANVG